LFPSYCWQLLINNNAAFESSWPTAKALAGYPGSLTFANNRWGQQAKTGQV
jgi:hypothetical protein